FLYGDRVVVLTPLAALQADQSYEVVVEPSVRDVDGVRKGGDEGDVIAVFTTDREPSDLDGRIVTTLPLDDAREVPRETRVTEDQAGTPVEVRRGSDVFVVFDTAVDIDSITADSFQVTAEGVPLEGTRSLPVQIAGVPDPRLVRFRANDPLPPAARLGARVASSITCRRGEGELEFGRRTPFARFTTVAGAAPLAVEVGNATPGFPNQVNAANFPNLAIDVDVDDS